MKSIRVATQTTSPGGYSSAPLAQKLGIKPGQHLVALGAPAHYVSLLHPLPDDVVIAKRAEKGSSFVHLFAIERAILETELARLRHRIDASGIIWVSWPKKAARVPTDITENVIRDIALPLGFVDVKVCAVDETWSGLKLMIRRENRTIPKK